MARLQKPGIPGELQKIQAAVGGDLIERMDILARQLGEENECTPPSRSDLIRVAVEKLLASKGL